MQEMQETQFEPCVQISRRRKRQSIPVFLPGESQRQRSLLGYSPWGHKESDMTEQLIIHTHQLEEYLPPYSVSQLSCSVVPDCLRPHESQHARPPCPSPTPGVHSDSTSIESVMPSSHLIPCRPLLLPPIPPSIRVFSNESTLRMKWPKYWSFSFSIIPSKEILGLVSFRMDRFDLLAVQGTLKSLLHSSNASILQCSAFFTVQLSHPYMTTGKVKEESEKVGLRLNIQKTKIMASSPITSWQIDGETV